MICLKNLAKNYQLAIVTSIHQPNSDVLMMFDKLYVLAKGGCVFDGQTNQLKSHLQKCQVNCQQDQVPTEQLIKVASKRVSFITFKKKNNFKKLNRKMKLIIKKIKLTI